MQSFRVRQPGLRISPSPARERGLLISAALALSGYLFMVWWAESSAMALDHAARSAVQLARLPLLDGAMAEISRLGLIATLCAVPVLLVAYSRLYLDRHWLTDLVEIARRPRATRALGPEQDHQSFVEIPLQRR